jgi:hypothetical protein
VIKLFSNILKWFYDPVSIYPLVTMRVVFGGIMAFSIARFWHNGWIESLYIQPLFHFSWFGLDFIQPLPGVGMYIVFALLFISALFIMLGLFFRIAAPAFFLLFTYVELIDKTPYLNHYYFISIVALLLCFTSANKALSIDVKIGLAKKSLTPRYQVVMFIIQLCVVYFFAGFAKLNTSWLIEAMPMQIWLPARADMPLVGSLFRLPETAYVFSWAGALYDLTIPFLLLLTRTRKLAYLAVVVFHLLTWYLFQIGMFPWIMIGMTLIFFPSNYHERFWSRFTAINNVPIDNPVTRISLTMKIFAVFLGIHFMLQLAIPLRSHFLTENVFWDEAGYRFSWRVMLMEKAGYVSFTIEDGSSGKRMIVEPSDYLTQLQEIQMSTQPDMILQFVQLLEKDLKLKGVSAPKIFADSYVTLNGSGSKRFVDPTIDLTTIAQSTPRSDWLLAEHAQFIEK